MDGHIPISKLNDFIFCPYSVYLHSVYENFSQKTYQRTPQTIGKIAHEPVDNKKYSTSAHILQGIDIYSEKYGLVGKIDIFDIKSGILVERKYKIKKIFDGQKYQLYAQMFCLKEMGYSVKSLAIQSLSDNKRYEIPLPNKNEMKKFNGLISKIKNYQPQMPKNKNNAKCEQCIYKPLCH